MKGGKELIITQGLYSNMTIRCDYNGYNVCKFTGTCLYDGDIAIKVRRNGVDVDELYTMVGIAKNGKFEGQLKDFPVGKGYFILIYICDTDEAVECRYITVKEHVPSQEKRDRQPIGIKSIKCRPIHRNYFNERYMWTEIEIKYDNIKGHLQYHGQDMNQIGGFSIYPEVEIKEIRILGDKIILYAIFQYYFANDLGKINISYTYEEDENIITDSQGYFIPTMTMASIDYYPNISPYLNYVKYSNLFDYQNDIKNLLLPGNFDQFFFKINCYWTNICSISELYTREEADGKYMFYKFNLKCLNAMDLKLHLGFSGPVKVWFNRKSVYYRSVKKKYINVHDAVIPCIGLQGINEVVIAYKATFRKQPKKFDYLNGITIKIEGCNTSYNDYYSLPHIVIE